VGRVLNNICCGFAKDIFLNVQSWKAISSAVPVENRFVYGNNTKEERERVAMERDEDLSIFVLISISECFIAGIIVEYPSDRLKIDKNPDDEKS
jgi:hypothetical protein